MSNKVIVFGSGKHARVVAYNIEAQGLYKIAGFITTQKTNLQSYDGYPLISSYTNFDIAATSRLTDIFRVNLFCLGFGSMAFRKRVFNFLLSQGWEAPNIIHPNAVVSHHAKLGKGVLIEAGCLITPNPEIGDDVVINTGSQVNHDNKIHDHVYIASGVIMSGSVVIGENTLIDDGVIVTIDKRVGANCLIGAGSVVTKDIPDGVIAYGNPCKVIRENGFE